MSAVTNLEMQDRRECDVLVIGGALPGRPSPDCWRRSAGTSLSSKRIDSRVSTSENRCYRSLSQSYRAAAGERVAVLVLRREHNWR